MLKRFLFANNSYDLGLTTVRIFAGIIIIPFGMEMFDGEAMSGYTKWLTDIGLPLPGFMAYLGKVAELVGGIFLILGLLTRLASVFLMITMAVITFVMSSGSITDMTFLLLLLFAVYLFSGGGKYSVDALIAKKLKND